MNPTVPEVLPLLQAYREIRGNLVGGSLHIFTEGNVSDGHVQFCLEQAREIGDRAGEALAEVLMFMSKTQRKKLAALFYA